MSNTGPQASFKAGPITFIPASIVLALFAIIIPVYLYPEFFLDNFLGLFPYAIVLIFIFYYDRERYSSLATIQVYGDRIHIIKKNETNSFRYSEITRIQNKPNMGKKLFVITLKDGRNIGLYERNLFALGKSFIGVLSERSGIDVSIAD